jgi:transposase
MDGRTHLAYMAEHAVDLESEFLLAARPAGDVGRRGDAGRHGDDGAVSLGPRGDAASRTADGEAGRSGSARRADHQGSGRRQRVPQGRDARTPRGPRRAYVVERDQRRVWTDKPDERKRTVLDNRRRTARKKGRRLQRRRSEVVERTFAHLCETGRARRSWLCGLEKVQNRYLMHAAARNLSLVMRKLFKVGTPRSLQYAGDDALKRLYVLLNALRLLAALQPLEASLRAAKIHRRRRSNSVRRHSPTAHRNIKS